MTHVDDLYEANDREPDEPEQEPPLDLDAVEESIRVYYGGSDDDSGKAAEELVTVVSRMATELREARERIAEFEALETRMEIVVASGHPDKAGLIIPFQSASKALDHADKTPGCKVFYRLHVLQPWLEIDPEAPF
ncbi:hypothetical protein ACIBQX_11735 [Nonomuraea sp. NPDC049714]|uniref:hypothetical protein n=1 Tax=Nonomuraea sp. NPDC049714 TaxID=3364357 RepID=UPI0037B542CC